MNIKLSPPPYSPKPIELPEQFSLFLIKEMESHLQETLERFPELLIDTPTQKKSVSVGGNFSLYNGKVDVSMDRNLWTLVCFVFLRSAIIFLFLAFTVLYMYFAKNKLSPTKNDQRCVLKPSHLNTLQKSLNRFYRKAESR